MKSEHFAIVEALSGCVTPRTALSLLKEI